MKTSTSFQCYNYVCTQYICLVKTILIFMYIIALCQKCTGVRDMHRLLKMSIDFKVKNCQVMTVKDRKL